jgi:hypothetical protein
MITFPGHAIAICVPDWTNVDFDFGVIAESFYAK